MSVAYGGERAGRSRSRRAGQMAGQEVWRPGSDGRDQDPLPDPTQTLSQELPGSLTPLPSEFSVFVSTGQDHRRRRSRSRSRRRKGQSGSQQSPDDGHPSTPFTRLDERFHRASGPSRSTRTDSSLGVMSASCQSLSEDNVERRLCREPLSLEEWMCPPLPGQVPVGPSETTNGRTAQGALEEASPVKKSSTEKPTERRKRKGIGSFFRWLRKAMKSPFGCCGHSSAVDVVEPFVPPADLEPEPDREPSPAPDHSAVKTSNDQKSLQSISSSVELIDLEEPPVKVIEVLPAAEPLLQEELQTQVHDSPVSLTAGETSPLTKQQDSNEVNMRPEDDICCRYAIGSKLGQGGFGVVYKGTRLADGQKVAVKFVRKTKHTECIRIPDHPEPLPKEVALTILANKGPVTQIIKLLDWQDQQDFYVMVLERFSHCVDVFHFVSMHFGGSIGEKFARLIMWGATVAADACCRQGVYHGDIKLENLLIDFKKLEVKLIDFGCGDLLTESAYTRFCGTVMYCPPEYRMKGEFHGKPATVWSLGILLFRILCGHFPDTFDFYRINMNTWYKPDLTEDCCHLICSLLQQKPERRLDLDRIVHHKWF